MKKHLLSVLITTMLILICGFQQTRAQDKKASKVHITITENDQVTTDTTFEIEEGQDPELIKKVVSQLAGGDIDEKHMKKEIHMSHGSSDNMVWVQSDGEKVWHDEMLMEGINIDSIKEAHKDAKILVIKNKDGEVMVKELDESEEHELKFIDDDDCELHEMILIDSDKEGHVMHISKQEKGKKVMMITESGDAEGEKTVTVVSHAGDCDAEGRNVEVFVHGDNDVEWTEGEHENVEVYVIKNGDKDVKVVKKIRVEIEDEDGSKAEMKKEKTEKKKKEK